VLGLGTYTFTYARGWAYLTDDAGACANCHVMHEQYDGWIKSSHRSLAVCNDCSCLARYTMVTRQEIRSFVCGQCHVEYYSKARRSGSPIRGPNKIPPQV